MSSPRDWFRRGRSEPLDVIPPDAADPFENGPVLAIGRSRRAALERAEPGFPREQGAEHPEPVDRRATASGRSTVPPPPPRSSNLRSARVIDPEAFTVRPEIPRPPNVPEPRPVVPSAVAEAVFAVTRKAVPLQRRAAAPSGGTQSATVYALQSAAVRPAAPVAEEPRTRIAAAQAPAALPRRARQGRERDMQGDDEARARYDATAESADVPNFTLAAPGVSWVKGTTTLNDAGTMNAVLRDAFTPTRPKQHDSLFSGRYKQMHRIIAAIEEERAHVVLYGERGSGKTSLANIVAAKAEEAGYYVLKSACSSRLSFEDIFHSFLRRIPATFLADGLGASNRTGIEHFDQLMPAGELGVPELIQVLSRLHDRHVILVIDEYDRIANEDTKNKLAELIKNMSDASAPVTILLIGVAENVDELLGQHPSLQRTLVTVPLPLMSDREIDGIIAAGEQKSGISFAPEVRSEIVRFAQGLPYHAQLLCLFGARSALRHRSVHVGREDLRYALLRAVEEAENQVKDAYNLAVGSDGEGVKDVLLAAAECPSDDFGTFAATDLERRLGASAEASALVESLNRPERGAVLRRLPTADGLRYQFFNQMMRHYVLVRLSLERDSG